MQPSRRRSSSFSSRAGRTNGRKEANSVLLLLPGLPSAVLKRSPIQWPTIFQQTKRCRTDPLMGRHVLSKSIWHCKKLIIKFLLHFFGLCSCGFYEIQHATVERSFWADSCFVTSVDPGLKWLQQFTWPTNSTTHLGWHNFHLPQFAIRCAKFSRSLLTSSSCSFR